MTTRTRAFTVGFTATSIAVAFLIAIGIACQEESLSHDAGFAAARIVPIGCVPNDGLDDRVCIQDALDASCSAGAGTVFLEAGIWNVTRPVQVPGNRDNASLWMECSNLALFGEGPATVLMMTGDGYATDWSAVRISGSVSGAPTDRVSVSDMTIASDNAFNMNEQTHLLMLGSTVNAPATISNVQIHNLRLRHPVRPEVVGDCLRMVGEFATPISFVDVGSVIFESCDRSGWAVQRGVEDVTFHDSQFANIGKTAIDMEPSGTGYIRRILMSGLNIRGSGISISGQATTRTTGVILASSYVGGRVGITYATGVLLAGNLIEEVTTASEGTLMIRGSRDVTVTGGSIKRLAGSAAGPAVKLVGTNGNYSNDVTITGVDIVTEIAGSVVDIESAQDVTLSGNRISGTDVTAHGIKAVATGQDLDRLQFEGNRIRGPFQYAIKVAGAPANVGVLQVVGNTSSGSTVTNNAGLRCENQSKFLKPIVHGSYYYDGVAVAVSGCASVVTQRP